MRSLILANSRVGTGTDRVREAQRKMEWTLRRWGANKIASDSLENCPAQDPGGQTGVESPLEGLAVKEQSSKISEYN